jgi:predicted short-subunit dehydrogenase-like oxidoreductase (DUF2520 family)
MNGFDERLPRRWALVGAGRLGTALAPALREAGLAVAGPLRRGEAVPRGTEAVLLCVPDREIAAAAAALAEGPRGARPGSAADGRPAEGAGALLVGHASGLTPLAPLLPHEAFGLHPLVSAAGPGTRFAGAAAAVAGSTPRALGAAVALAGALGMTPLTVADADRPAYHAAASLAANALVVLEGAAERLLATAGLPREALAPLARGALERWAADGASSALTGPVVRGDEATIAAQRAAIAQRTPEALALFDAYVAAGRGLAAR